MCTCVQTAVQHFYSIKWRRSAVIQTHACRPMFRSCRQLNVIISVGKNRAAINLVFSDVTYMAILAEVTENEHITA